MISPQDIDKIMNATNIVDVVGDFVELKKRGANYIGLCPFHNEKTPSFNVNPARGIFKCFGCGKGGNAVNFLMEYQHFTYPEALRWLAHKYGIDIQEKELSEQEIAQRDEKDALYALNDFACKYFHNNLMQTEEGRSLGLSYFQERAITQKTIDTWLLGYSKQKSNDFALYALHSGYTEQSLITSGLCIKSDKDGSLFDRFHGRVTFPIYNVGGRVIGFSCRILSNDKTKAKYINSPESPIYTKGKNLFGLNFARNEIAKQDLCYLVEGNVDAVMMYQNEVKNVVASNGTALTEDQVHLIKRYTSNVAVLYDGDAAGIHAAIRATDMFLKEGLHVSIVLFPDGDDPDSFARKHTQDEFQKFLKDNAQNFIIYRCNLALQQAQSDPLKKASLVKDILHSISLVPDLIERAAFVQQCANILSMREDVLLEQLNKEIVHNAFLEKKEEKKEHAKQQQTILPEQEQKIEQDIVTNQTFEQSLKQQQVEKQQYIYERNIIRLLVNYGQMLTNQKVVVNGKIEMQSYNAAAFILQDIKNNNIVFQDPICKKILDYYYQAIDEQKKILSADEIMAKNDSAINELISTLIMDSSKIEISQNWEKYGMFVPDLNSQSVVDKDIAYHLLSVKLFTINQAIEKVKQQAKDNPQNENILNVYRQLMSMRNIIAKELKRTIM